MQLTLPQLAYPYTALEPFISRSTLELHHGKHHRAYVEKTKDLARELRMTDQPLESIVLQTAGKAACQALFNNAAQAWNHAFYWRSLLPQSTGRPEGELAGRIDAEFGSFEAFANQFAAAAVGQFGAGWAWLVSEGGQLRIVTTSNADTPLVHGQSPLLTLDVWEHAYYLDYQYRRMDYVTALIHHVLNWDFANRNLIRSRSAARGTALHAEAS